MQPLSKHRSEEKHRQILQAAMRLFTEQGFEATSMEQIAQEAKVSKQTIYSHFGSKDVLFGAALHQKCDQHALSAEFFVEGEAPRTTLLRIAQAFSTLITTPEALAVYRTCLAQVDTYPQIAQRFFELGPNAMIERLARCLDEFHQRGLLNIPNTRYAATQFLMLCHGEQRYRAALHIYPLLSPQQQDAYLNTCVDLFLKGYAI